MLASDGSKVQVLQQPIQVATTSAGGSAVTLPFRLAPGQRLASFNDETTGVAWSADERGGGQLSLPLSGGLGRVTVTLAALVPQPEGAQADVLSASLELGPVTVRQEGSQAGAVTFARALDGLPPDLGVHLLQVDITGTAVSAALQKAALDSNLRPRSAAFAFELSLDPPTLGTRSRPTNIVMAVDSAWVDSQGNAGIRIVKLNGDGTVQTFPAHRAGLDQQGQVRFEASYSGTLSIFALASFSPPETPPVAPSGSALKTWLIIGVSAVVVIYGAAAIIWQVRRGGKAKGPP